MNEEGVETEVGWHSMIQTEEERRLASVSVYGCAVYCLLCLLQYLWDTYCENTSEVNLSSAVIAVVFIHS